MSNEKLQALIEGGLSRTTGFKPTEDHPEGVRVAAKYLEWEMAACRIPIKRLMWVRGANPFTFIIHAECCIRTFRERCHNRGLKFRAEHPHSGTSISCIVEVVLNMEDKL